MSAREEFKDHFAEENLAQETLRELHEMCKPYTVEAFGFVLEALEFTQEKLRRRRHVTGRELLDGIVKFGKESYGPMALSVFEHWGIQSTEDFGKIVFALVEKGVLSKTNKDSPADFQDVYDLKRVFH